MNKFTTPALLLASSLVVFGCLPELEDDSTDTATDAVTTDGTETDSGTDTDGGTDAAVRGQVAAITDSTPAPSDVSTDTGELRYVFEQPIANGSYSLDINYASDETETVSITLFGAKASNSNRLVELRIDSGYATQGDGYVGIQHREFVGFDSDGDPEYTQSATQAEFLADEFVSISIDWDQDSGTYTMTVDGTAYAAADMLEVTNDTVVLQGLEDVGYAVAKISDNSGKTASATPFYVDNFTIESDVTTDVGFSDDFEGYAVDFDLVEGVDSPFNSNGFQAVVSDAFVQ